MFLITNTFKARENVKAPMDEDTLHFVSADYQSDSEGPSCTVNPHLQSCNSRQDQQVPCAVTVVLPSGRCNNLADCLFS